MFCSLTLYDSLMNLNYTDVLEDGTRSIGQVM